MAEKTIVEKAGETVGYGIAMASDVAGSIKTAFDAAVTSVTKVLKKAPAKKTPAKKAAKKALAKKAAKKTVAKKTPKDTCKEGCESRDKEDQQKGSCEDTSSQEDSG